MDTNDSNSNSSIKIKNEEPQSDGEEKGNKQQNITDEKTEEREEETSDQTTSEVNETQSAASSKKNGKESGDKKVQNMRKNIKGVLEDTQLDESTLAAQKLELERLTRVQEAQRLLRESQRQILAEKQVFKTQQKVLSLLGETNDTSDNDVTIVPTDVESIIREKSPNLDISISSEIQTSKIECDSESNKLVVIDSDSDDCIILSDDDEEELGSDDDENNSGEHTNDAYNSPDAEGRVVINIGHKENEEKIFIAPQIARVIKPHQIGGIRFLFDNIIESKDLFNKSTGFGCILAHSMGLGKTLQIVCFCDVLMRNTATKNILIIMPINTIQNWMNEFNLWTPMESTASSDEVIKRNFKIYAINESHKSLGARTRVVLDWKKEGGVLLLGYEMFRLLSLKKMSTGKKQKMDVQEMTKREEESYTGIYEALVDPGPDVVVCDEGHRIKNACEYY
jgi:RAD54-like protein 2